MYPKPYTIYLHGLFGNASCVMRLSASQDLNFVTPTLTEQIGAGAQMFFSAKGAIALGFRGKLLKGGDIGFRV